MLTNLEHELAVYRISGVELFLGIIFQYNFY